MDTQRSSMIKAEKKENILTNVRQTRAFPESMAETGYVIRDRQYKQSFPLVPVHLSFMSHQLDKIDKIERLDETRKVSIPSTEMR